MSNNTLVIESTKSGEMLALPAPDNPWVAHSAWLFFVENLKPGFNVSLVTADVKLSQQSGTRTTIEEYASIFNQVGGKDEIPN